MPHQHFPQVPFSLLIRLQLGVEVPYAVMIHAFPNDRLQTSKMREFADDNFRFDENGRKFFKQISPFPAVFSKDLYCRHVKTRACLGKS